MHGPHGHALEQAPQHAPPGMAGQLAVATAILAAAGAMLAWFHL